MASLVVIAIVVGASVSTSSKNKNRSVSYTPPAQSGNAGGGIDGGSGGGSGGSSSLPNDYGFKFYQDLQEFYVYQEGSEYYPEAKDSGNAISLEVCLSFCSDYSVALYSWTNEGDSCWCYDDIDCLVPHGPSIDSQNYVAEGVLRTKSVIETCDFDYCQAFPNYWKCFTGNTYDLQQVSVTSPASDSTDEVSSDRECLKYCSDYAAARYSSNVEGDRCICYAEADCLTAWGDQVDTANFVADGTIYTKKPTEQCSLPYCESESPDGFFCLTGNTFDFQTFWIRPDAINATGSVSSAFDCLEFCAMYDAAEYTPSGLDINGITVKCWCYDSAECLLPLGIYSFKSAPGRGYVKYPLLQCDLSYCDVYSCD